MNRTTLALQTKLDRWLAFPMSLLSLIFLIFLAGGLQEKRGGITWPLGTIIYWQGLLVLWPIFLIEPLVLRLATGKLGARHILSALIPPLRLVGHDMHSGETVWFPKWGWVKRDRDLTKRLEKILSIPMTFIAILVLPILIAEYFAAEYVQKRPALGFMLDTGTSVIWLAFTMEFIVMISVVDKKLKYCTEHWLDLLIILVPLSAILRALQLANLLRLGMVVQATQVYRVRGVILRFYRGTIALDLIRRLIGISPEKRLELLCELIEEKEHELSVLHKERSDLQVKCAEREQELNTP